MGQQTQTPAQDLTANCVPSNQPLHMQRVLRLLLLGRVSATLPWYFPSGEKLGDTSGEDPSPGSRSV